MRKHHLQLLTPEEIAFQIGFLAYGLDEYYALYDDQKLKECWLSGFNAHGALVLINTDKPNADNYWRTLP
ncbi:MAG TPA: hypothetical protein ENK70_01235 [Methylophaga sp.]|nr:hypothetical protein [Methylophaga sp.]